MKFQTVGLVCVTISMTDSCREGFCLLSEACLIVLFLLFSAGMERGIGGGYAVRFGPRHRQGECSPVRPGASARDTQSGSFSPVYVPFTPSFPLFGMRRGKYAKTYRDASAQAFHYGLRLRRKRPVTFSNHSLTSR